MRELLAVVLAAVRGPEAGHWSLARETTGQPVLAGPGAPAVSLAHREAWLACALGSAGSLGVDIEVMQARDWAAVADSLFAASERAWLLNAGGEERCRRGYRLWTLKEAFLKANGAAAGFPLTELVFDTDGRVVACPNRCGAPQDWHSRHWQWSDAVSVALVWSANHAVPA
ncbi:MAG: 4'-phosphopantetheinyl transferase family protein [Burkholderiales bacterium]